MRRIQVIPTIRTALQLISERRRLLFRAVVTPLILLSILDVVGVLSLSLDAKAPLLLYPIYAVIYAVFAVACYDILASSSQEYPTRIVLRFTHREVRFIAAWLFVSAVGWSLRLLSVVGNSHVMEFAINYDYWRMIYWPWAFAILGMGAYVKARISLVLPASILGGEKRLQDVWGLSCSNGWRLALIFAGPLLLGSGISAATSVAAFSAEHAVWSVGLGLARRLVSVLEIALITVAFIKLGGFEKSAS